MPVIRSTVGSPDVSPYQDLWEELARELQNPRSFGEPMVQEEEFPRAGLIGITVIWNRFRDLPDAVRPRVVSKAYEEAGKADIIRRAGFTIGYTVREAVLSGLLPFKLWVSGHGPGPDTADQVKETLKQNGVPVLKKSGRYYSPFQSEQQAEDCKTHLVRQHPHYAEWLSVGWSEFESLQHSKSAPQE